MQINYSLGLLLETRSEDIYRMKGLLSIAGSEYRYVYQAGHTFTCPPAVLRGGLPQ